MEPQAGADWIIVSVWSPHRALDALRRVETIALCCPRTTQRVYARNKRGWREARGWLFPGYIFAQAPRRIDHDRILAAAGVLGFVRHAGIESPAVCPEPFVAGLLAMGDVRIRSPYDEAPFRVGQAVLLKAGPFAGAISRVARVDKRTRVRILLDVFGGQREIEVPAVDLVDASQDDESAPRPVGRRTGDRRRNLARSRRSPHERRGAVEA